MIKNYYLLFSQKDSCTEIWLNNILINRNIQINIENKKLFLNPYIIDGKNTLTIKILSISSQHFTIKGTLCEYSTQTSEKSAVPSTSVLTSLNYSFAKLPHTPFDIHREFTLKSPFGKWVWELGDDLNINGDTNLSIFYDFLTMLHQACSLKDIKQIDSLIKVKNEEYARASYLPYEYRHTHQIKFFEEIFSDSQFAMEPLKLEHTIIHSMANNRLFAINSLNGKSPIESKLLSLGHYFYFPLIVSRIQNHLVIVR